MSAFLDLYGLTKTNQDLAINQSKSDSHQEHDYLQHWWYTNNEKIFIHIIKLYDIRQYQALRVLKLDYKQPTQFHLPSHGKQTLQEPAHDQKPLISNCTMKLTNPKSQEKHRPCQGGWPWMPSNTESWLPIPCLKLVAPTATRLTPSHPFNHKRNPVNVTAYSDAIIAIINWIRTHSRYPD